MKVSEAKSQIIRLIGSQLDNDQFAEIINSETPDQSDTNKFSILGRPARAIHRFSGWHIPINLDWFSGGQGFPNIKGHEFFWYAIAIPTYSGFTNPHYLICDYLTMRNWVLEFDSPLGVNYRHQRYWRADIELHEELNAGIMGYFRWGDEPSDIHNNPSRKVLLDNISQIMEAEFSARNRYRITGEVSRIVRDSHVVNSLKALYQNKCQVCGIALGPSGNGYSEGHHIRPLGQPHNGPDATNNVLILCPNHHAEFDLGYIAANPDTMAIVHIDPQNEFNDCVLHVAEPHDLSRELLTYHLVNIFGTRQPHNS